MFEDIILVHRLTERDPAPLQPAHDASSVWVVWKTCVRQIALGTAASRVVPLSAKKGDDVFTGAAAYTFFLEVVCGLHSPVLGETEIMGQFKELAAEVAKAESRSKPSAGPAQLIHKFLSAALTDTKEVRETHLRDLGNRSYGSLLRKHVKGSSALNIIGAGKLVREILPWLANKAPVVTVHCRRRKQGEELVRDFSSLKPGLKPKFKIETWPLNAESGVGGAWIIAAPIKAREIRKALETVGSRGHAIERIVDLRDASQTDPLNFRDIEVLKLKDFFNQMAGTHKEVQDKADRAKELIAELCLKRFRAVEIRPFGWEDLCG